MPEPVGSRSVNLSYYDEANGVCADPSSASLGGASHPNQPSVGSGLDDDPASAQLVKGAACLPEKIALVQAGISALSSATAVAMSTPTVIGTLPSLAAFVASSIAVGKAAAELETCLTRAELHSVGSGL